MKLLELSRPAMVEKFFSIFSVTQAGKPPTI